MSKQDYLIKLLEALRWTWIPAEGFLIVMKAWGFDDEITDTLIKLIEQAIQETDNQFDKQKLQSSLDILEKIKLAEQQSNIQDEKDCEELLDMLDAIA
jgi:aspartokinase